MWTLADIKAIVNGLKYIATFGLSELKDVKSDTQELIGHLTASLKSRWEMVKQVTSLDGDKFSKEGFDAVHDYFTNYYVDQLNIQAARTHCSTVRRDLNRIKFKLAKLLHTDLGKWGEADEHFKDVINEDTGIISRYEESIQDLRGRLERIREDLDAGRVEAAKTAYLALKADLRSDVEEIRSSIQVMEAAYAHVEEVVG